MDRRRYSPPRILLLVLLTAAAAVASSVPLACSPPSEISSANEARTDGGGDAAASDLGAGAISIFASAFNEGMSANFAFRARDEAQDPRCGVTKSGACTLTECTDFDGSTNRAHAVNAGTIVFEGGYPKISFTVSPNADGSYSPNEVLYDRDIDAGLRRPFIGGEPATLTASGGTVPAFSHSLRYPLLFILDDPAVPEGTSDVSVSRAKDFSFAWSRGSADADLIVHGANDASGKQTYLSCEFPSAPGNATIPQSMLTKLSPQTTLILLSAARATSQAGDFKVRTYLAGEVINPSKKNPIRLIVQ